MQDNHTQTCFILLPGLAPDSFPVFKIKQALENKGYATVASNFFGDKEIDNFSDLTIDQCRSGIAKLIEEAGRKYDKVVGIGISLGGALLLEHAKNGNGLNAVVSIGTPFKLKYKPFIRICQALIPVVNPVWNRFQKIKRLRLFPIGAVGMTVKYLENGFAKNLNMINTPTMFIHSKKDQVCDYQAVLQLVSQFSVPTEIITLDNGTHTIDDNPELIVKHVETFLDKLP